MPKPDDRLLSRMRTYTLKHGMLEHGDRVLVMFSAGPDSTVLLHLLSRLREEFRLDIRALHCNHGLRPDADADERAAGELCARLGLPFLSRRIDVLAAAAVRGMGVEEGARWARYQAARQVAADVNASKTALGHTSDDSAEWSLMNFVRGASLRGLTGIPRVGAGGIIRPLMCASRKDILAYLREHSLPSVTDSTNTDMRFLRNRVRNQVLPAILAMNPSFTASVSRTARLLDMDASYMEEIYARERGSLFLAEGDGSVSLDRDMLAKAHQAIQARALHEGVLLLSPSNARCISAPIVECLDLIERNVTSASIDLAGGVTICIDRDAVVISTSVSEPISEQPLELGGSTDVPGFGSIQAVYGPVPEKTGRGGRMAVLDAAKVAPPLRVRGWRAGDWFIPLGMRGRKKLQDYFVDAKVPRRLRARVPIVEDQEKLLWIVGHRIDDRVRVGPETGRALVLTFTDTEG